MRHNFQRLQDILQKEEKIILGLMSGTSLDGLDLALGSFQGQGLDVQWHLLHFHTHPYPEALRREMEDVAFQKEVKLEQLCLLNTRLAHYYAEVILATMEAWHFPINQVDLIASHGQTIYHAPRSLPGLDRQSSATLQMVDGDHIAYATGCITLSDFRQKHVAAGGEGAPLATYGDYLLFSHPAESRILLNIGGIANFSYLPEQKNAAPVWSTDTGPGNTLLNQVVKSYFPELTYDPEGSIARTGQVDESLLKALKDEPFFQQKPPKTTGPELFNLDWLRKKQMQAARLKIKIEDLLATLTQLTAETIADAVRLCPREDLPASVYVSGGGASNLRLIEVLKKALPDYKVLDFDDLGLPRDAKEAFVFALLAHEAITYQDSSAVYQKAGLIPVSMGKISLPY